MKKESLEAGKRSIQIEYDEIKKLSDYLDAESFSAAINALKKAERIMTCGCGNSGIAAKKFAHTLCCIERPAFFIPPSEAVHGGLGAVKQGDAVVLISRGGKTDELLTIAEVANKRKVTLIIVTERPDSPLGKMADIILPLKIARESDKHNLMATSSFIVTVALFDALIAALIEETNFTPKQFAVIHPGGAVGKKLNS